MTYTDFMKGIATTTIDDIEITMRPQNMRLAKYIIQQNDDIVGRINFNWKCHAYINILNDDGETSRERTIKATNFRATRFTVVDESGETIFNIDSDTNRKNLSFTHTIEIVNIDDVDEAVLQKLMVYIGYALNVMYQMSSLT